MDLVWRYWINRVGLCDLNRCLAAVMGPPYLQMEDGLSILPGGPVASRAFWT